MIFEPHWFTKSLKSQRSGTIQSFGQRFAHRNEGHDASSCEAGHVRLRRPEKLSSTHQALDDAFMIFHGWRTEMKPVIRQHQLTSSAYFFRLPQHTSAYLSKDWKRGRKGADLPGAHRIAFVGDEARFTCVLGTANVSANMCQLPTDINSRVKMVAYYEVDFAMLV